MRLTIDVPLNVSERFRRLAYNRLISVFGRKHVTAEDAEGVAARALGRALEKLVAWEGGSLKTRTLQELEALLEEAVGKGNVPPTPQTGEDHNVRE